MTRSKESTEAGRYAYDGLDRVLHEKARLGILTSLMSHPEGLSFSELRGACALTDGNLARHLQVLSDASYVEVRRTSDPGRPHSVCRLSAQGRRRFVAYLAELERVIQDAMSAEARAGRPRKGKVPDLGPGWAPA